MSCPDRLVPQADITRMSKSVQGVLVDLPVFHDQVEIPAGVSNEIEVLKWITIHHEKVGQCALLNHAELARVWIAKTGQSKQFGVC
jgi:hypothetical protein